MFESCCMDLQYLFNSRLLLCEVLQDNPLVWTLHILESLFSGIFERCKRIKVTKPKLRAKYSVHKNCVGV